MGLVLGPSFQYTVMKIRKITGKARYFSLEVYVQIQVLKSTLRFIWSLKLVPVLIFVFKF